MLRVFVGSPDKTLAGVVYMASQICSVYISRLKGKWQQNFLSSYLKESPKQYVEVYYRIFIFALFGEIF